MFGPGIRLKPAQQEGSSHTSPFDSFSWMSM
jgi:hypothetical protein